MSESQGRETTGAGAGPAGAARRPNILLIMADELVAALTGAYGHPVVRTPNLERLAGRGVRFEAAYSPAPLCAPARACLVSGQYSSTNRVYDNAALFAADIPCMGHYLTNAGYDCVLSGKMHFVGPDQLHGFRRRLTTDIYAEEFNMLDNRAPWSLARDPAAFEPQRGRGRHAQNYVGSNVHVGRWHHHLSYDEEAHFRALEYLRARGAVKALAEQRWARAGSSQRGPGQAPLGAEERSAERQHVSEADGPQPWFLCVSFHHPHEPFWPPQDVWDLYEGEAIETPEYPPDMEARYSAMDRWLNANHGIRFFQEELRSKESLYRVRRAYYALVTYVDRKVGELLATLEEHGLWEDTVVVFTSDHGDMLCEKSMVQKRIFYEWSCRVPLLMRFPGDAYAGRVVTEPVNLIDLLPTFLDLAGIPEAARLPMDGQSLMGLVDGAETAPRTSFAEMHVEDNPVLCFMVRRGRFKLNLMVGVDAQLFDLQTDPDEWHNLSGKPEYAEVERELRGAIEARFDFGRIEADVRRSIASRRLIREAMRRNGTLWDYAPHFDPSKDALQQYLR
ncbi:MAG TPA: sulfatase-like hydrolase/transferase [Chloroflexota bacterium]|nr:sulfatase-like hydrolase/transferase [Chloroflexota bacterium]